MRLSKNWQIGGGGRGGVGIGLIILFILSGFCGDSHVAVRESRGEDFIFARRHSTLQTRGGGGGGKDTSFPMQETQKWPLQFFPFAVRASKNKASNLFYNIVFPFNAKPETPHVNSQKFEAATLFFFHSAGAAADF